MKVVLITGASSGIGKATAEQYIKRGYKVYSFARRDCDIEGVVSISGDITVQENIDRAVKQIIDTDGYIDILVNNAGMGVSGPVEELSMDAIEKQMNVNFMGTVRMTKAVLPYMRERKSGCIVNIDSPAGSIFPMPYQAFYASSKAAITMFTHSLRVEVKPFNIKVCTVMPGDTKTGFTDAREKTQDSSVYKAANISVARMEKYERKGISPDKVAKVIVRTSEKKNPPPTKIVGFIYRVYAFLNRIAPKRLVLWILPKIY